MKLLFFLLAIFSSANCYINNPHINIKKQSIINYNRNKFIEKPNRFMLPIKAVDEYCPANLQKFLDSIKIEYGEKIVKLITEFLPTADGIAPHVLHANEAMINLLLNSDSIPIDLKKQLILNVIKISMFGDSIGSSMLQIYYELVNCLL